ncbi:centrosomal protein [Anaeramoeba flamelloides]|uniref:Centrosomal protein n=1 Tax=Anaeramoeba flamelloides TaxID=1746091 RepID=A0ABQ8XWG0_9EUKA|nr:centrosomal protein [Anaeramoeba flamelloides]
MNLQLITNQDYVSEKRQIQYLFNSTNEKTYDVELNEPTKIKNCQTTPSSLETATKNNSSSQNYILDRHNVFLGFGDLEDQDQPVATIILTFVWSVMLIWEIWENIGLEDVGKNPWFGPDIKLIDNLGGKNYNSTKDGEIFRFITPANSHEIKKRHYKKYLKRLENSKLPVSILNGEGTIVDITSTFLKEVGWVGQDHLFKNHKPGRISAKKQKHFECDTPEAIKKAVVLLMKSKDGLLTIPWDGTDQFGEKNPLWIYCTLISVSGKPFIQTIWKKRKVMEDSQLENPEEIDSSLLKVNINDSTSVTSKETSTCSEITPKREKEKISQKHNTSMSHNTENSNFPSNIRVESDSTITSQSFALDDIEEQNEIDQVIETIKKQSRALDNMDYEMELIKNVNSLSQMMEQMKKKRDEQIGKLNSRLRTQNSKHKNKVLELEEYYQKKFQNFEKENKKNKKLNKEIKRLKQTVSTLYHHLKQNQKKENKLLIDIESDNSLKLSTTGKK